MSESDNIISPVEDLSVAPVQKRSWIGRVFWGLVTVFVGIHIYALALKFIPVPGTILMAQRAMGGEDIKRNWTRLEDFSPFLVSAVIAAEDAKFCQHEGIDWDAVQDAFDHNSEGGRRRGGSTITQQTAKNVFLWNGGGFVRKVPEAWMASFIDYTWGKKRVMEMYLNIAEWGDGIFGAEAAAQTRFNKSAKDLTPRQAALLASVLPSPNKWRVDPPGEYVNKRARTVQARLFVVRNEGYADCVLGPPPKRTRPKPKAEPEPDSTLAPEVKDEPAIEEPVSEPVKPPVIEEEVLEPISETPEAKAPESEEDAGIEIKAPTEPNAAVPETEADPEL